MRRPISLLTIVIAAALAGFLALDRMSRDIFPDLGVPVLYVAQPYGGLDPAQMEGFITNYYEYHFLYITGIEHVESKSIQGVALIKLQFHPGTNMAQATAETVSYVDRARAFMPTGTVPPFVVRFDQGSVPVGDLVFSSKTKTVAELQDAALFKVRPLFATLPGVSAPPPFGSSQRTILVRLDPGKLRSYNMSPDEVVRALAAGNTVSPSGNIQIGDLYPMVPVNSVVGDVTGLGNIPIRSQGTRTIFIRDVGSVEDGADIQTGYALVNGRRTVYIPVTKRADASTLAVVQAVKANLPRFQSVLPNDIKVSYQFDQSPLVTGAIRGLFFEGALGVVLTGLMVLLFLRDWRSSLVVVLNIPLAILASVTALSVSGQTINIMTLGGLALAVGFSMVGSYLLSRTFVPVLAVFPLMQTSIVLLQFHHARKVGGQQRSALSRVLALENGENRRQDDQRRDGPARQAADDGASERGGLRAAFPEADRHRQHARDHRAARHQDRPQPARRPRDRRIRHVGAVDPIALGEGDEQDRIGHRHADRHDRAHQRLDVQRRAGDPQRDRNAGDDRGDREHDRERQPEGLKIRRQQQKDHDHRDEEPELEAAEHLLHRHDLPAHGHVHALRRARRPWRAPATRWSATPPRSSPRDIGLQRQHPLHVVPVVLRRAPCLASHPQRSGGRSGRS